MKVNFQIYLDDAVNCVRKAENMEELTLKDEFIKLGQALKACGLAESGAEAKQVILDGLVLVNGRVELQRGKKLYPDDVVTYQGKSIRIKAYGH